MSAVAVAPREVGCAHGERALDEVIVHAWEELIAGRGCGCPVCSGEMEPEGGAWTRALNDARAARSGEAGWRAGGKPAGGRCKSCGAGLH